ncbi:hypothetical protein K432DRAFT_392315 [Lepidopterella palustris CBS 459.81]|uniref:Uncharacterized protein n=1 Tax=Lepidopterella palustris CBS 459.81 TaxID=1314670 RepID=A0A8E2JG93_9PEZI|nr:hypothetical protein K432DRAFT_392315 [Lepidopterella palustris CBS 459.81]
MNRYPPQRQDHHGEYLSSESSDRPPSPAASQISIPSVQSLPTSDPDGAPARDPLAEIRLIKIEVHRKLTWWDVSALIINKMIGTGIFSGPPTILLYTGKKSTALWLWAAGFVYTLISMTLYLEYSRKLPYTGGELLDEIMPGPPLLAYTLYALYFVMIYTTTTNSMQFARQVIITATKKQEITDQRVWRLIAVVITSVICLLLYFSTSTGRRLNRYLAYLKIGMMLILFLFGAIKAGKHTAHDITQSFQTSHSSSATALLQVLFSFQGWENATLVAGEIPDNKTLRKGFIRAVWIVGLLYMLINLVYCYAIPWNSNGSMDSLYAPLFFGNSERAQQAWAILTALSAVGSMLSVTYTCVRVKQTIAWTNILPWSTFWRTSAPVRPREPKSAIEMQRLLSQTTPEDDDQSDGPVLRTGAPQGGLALHWASCVFFICVSASISNITEAISFSGQLLTYGHAIVGVFIGLFFPKLASVPYTLPENRGWDPQELPWWLCPRVCQWILGWLYAIGSIVILILAAIGPYVNTDGTTRQVKGWYYPAIMFTFFVAFAIPYYFSFIASEERSLVKVADVKLSRKQHGVHDELNLRRQCDFCAELNSKPHRHARDGYLNFNELHFPKKDTGRNFLYWFFGGPKERHYPDIRLDEVIPVFWAGVKGLSIMAWTGMKRLRPAPK